MWDEQNREEFVQAEWNKAVVRNFIRRMLLYYDPSEVAVMMCPDDQYDMSVDRVFDVLGPRVDRSALEDGLFNIFRDGLASDSRLKRQCRRMAEDRFEFFDESRREE